MVESSLKQFSNRDDLEQALASAVCAKLSAAILTNGFAVIAVSGGKTPVNLFKKMSLVNLDWIKVTVVLVDERVVAADNQASNSLLVQENLLSNAAAAANYINILDYKRHAEFFNTLVLDVVILGMGLDGHTASWFPCADNIQALFDTKAAVAEVVPKSAPYARVTLTPALLLKAKAVFVHIVGQDKLHTYHQALNCSQILMPINFVLQHQDIVADTYWSS